MKENRSKSAQRMRKLIIQAFIECRKHTRFENLTVQELIDQAMISRHTFYRYFHDKYDVAEEIQRDLLDSLTLFHQDFTHVAEGQEARTPEQVLAGYIHRNIPMVEAIQDIQTESIHLNQSIKHFFANHYQAVQPQRPSSPIESHIYQNILQAIMDYFSDQSTGPYNTLLFRQGLLYASLYSLGIHEERDIQAVMKFIEEMIKD